MREAAKQAFYAIMGDPAMPHETAVFYDQWLFAKAYAAGMTRAAEICDSQWKTADAGECADAIRAEIKGR